MPRKLTFEQACSQYVHRYTLEHVPAWARKPASRTTAGQPLEYYAPQFASDREWYENTKFPGESELADRRHCYTSGQTWPLGQWLNKPYRR